MLAIVASALQPGRGTLTLALAARLLRPHPRPRFRTSGEPLASPGPPEACRALRRPWPSMAELAEPAGGSNGATAETWRQTLDRVVPACVVLKVTQTRPFDTEAACSSYATGFVVDKARGLILTNRHVVTPGPTTSEAIFLNREEVPVNTLYYDPVHDFAFMQFDPTKLQFMELLEVPLEPSAACVGLDVRVVGNDSGEKVSILAGTLARLDRDAPVYGRKGYNDFNTFYLQAASGTKGGSSGSPVIDCHGRAVGLNAGGKNKAASAYYLPLERVVRTLRLLQQFKDPNDRAAGWKLPNIPRGDFQTSFVFKGFDEVRRLGLDKETEKEVRAITAADGASHALVNGQSTGMLVVDTTLPGGPADGLLEAGDVLVRLEGEVVTQFLPMEELLDNRVGQKVGMEVDRGGRQIKLEIEVADLHSVTPSCFLEFAAASIHALSYQQARNNRVKTGQVYVAEPGYVLGKAGVPKHAVLSTLNGIPTPDLTTFASVLKTLDHGTRVPLEYYTFIERKRMKNAIMQMDRQWYGPPVFWSRDYAAGTWHPTTAFPTQSSLSNPIKAEEIPEPTSPQSHPQNSTTEQGVDQAEAKIRKSMVLVDVDIPLVALSDGVHSKSFAGSGVVVHHSDQLGLVLVDRNTVAIGPCDVMLSFGAYPAEISGTVRFLHPLHNFAIVSYDPSDLPVEAKREICAAEILPSPPLKRGDQVVLVGLTESLRVMKRNSIVTNATLALGIPCAEVPRFRAVHEEVLKLDQDFGSRFSGLITDTEGRVRALWGSYAEQVDREEREWCAGLPAEVFYPWVDKLRNLEQQPAIPPPKVWVLNSELQPLLLSKAAHIGLPRRWINRLAQIDPERWQVLTVRSCTAQSHAADVLKDNDMVLAVDGKPISCFKDVEHLILNGNGSAELPEPTDMGRPRKRLKTEDDTTNNVQKAVVDSGETPCDASYGASLEPQESRNGKPDDPTTGTRMHARQQSRGCALDNSHEDACSTTASRMRARQQSRGCVLDNSHEDACSSAKDDARCLPLTVFRERKVLENVVVRLGVEYGMGTDRLVHWCGAQLQAPHRAVRELGFMPEGADGVYISRWHHGSPAHRYGLFALHWITEVNSVPTPDLDAFLNVTRPLPDGAFVRVKVCHLETTKPKVLTLKMDLRYWPTWELRLDSNTCKWTRHNISSLEL